MTLGEYRDTVAKVVAHLHRQCPTMGLLVEVRAMLDDLDDRLRDPDTGAGLHEPDVYPIFVDLDEAA